MNPQKSFQGKAYDAKLKYEMDIISPEKYLKALEAAHVIMSHGKFIPTVRAFESVIKGVLKDTMPFFPVFKVYANAAVCCFHGGWTMLGAELLDASLRMNPLYDFARQCKKKYLHGDGNFHGTPAAGEQRYEQGVFARYEEFLKESGIPLRYKTKTIPTIYTH